MAAGLALSGVASMGSTAQTFISKNVGEFERDPFLWLEEKCWRWGWGLLALGFIFSAIGVMLRAGAARAVNDLKDFLQQEAALFGNLTAGPTLRTGMSWNIGDDLGKVVGNVASVAQWPFATALNGLTDVGQAIWMAARNLPRVTFDEFAIVSGTVLGGLLDFIFPFMIVFGVVLVAVGASIRFVRSVIVPRVHIWGRARFQKRIAEPLDRFFGTREDIPKAVAERAATQKVEAVGGEETTYAEAAAAQSLPEGPAPAQGPGPVAPEPPEAPESHPTHETPPQSPGINSESSNTPPEAPPVPGGATTEETQEKLGETPYADAKRRLKAAKEAREREERMGFREKVEARQSEDREAAASEMRRALAARDSVGVEA